MVKHKTQNGTSVRQCALTREHFGKDDLLRFVLSPDGEVTPDIKCQLPGRGMWLRLDRAIIEKAKTTRLFQKSLTQGNVKISVRDDLGELIDKLLVGRLSAALGLAVKSGAAVSGFEKVKSALVADNVGARFFALDGAKDSARKLLGLNGADGEGAQLITLLDAETLSLAFGGKNVIHAAVTKGHGADQVNAAYGRLATFRSNWNE